MAQYKCKMCGGTLNLIEGSSVCECEYCGSKQTVPSADNEKKMKLYDRANRLRFNCEFDKAGSVYESIIAEFPEEAEAYWGNLLCKYGIEYVDDPNTGDKVPTCHRSSFDSFMDEEDFEMVMENADTLARSVYREQAKQIEEIRKGIIEVSGKEQPYDIFISYKEKDENGERTMDSVLAQDVYDALTEKGYRVFFSRISLEDKLGTEYEPYIFAALNSAKIMLAFGTNYDNYNAVWVKNEWSRYLKLMAKDKSKHLIPCYKGIDAYDMPKEFAKLTAQDMGKVGAMQDLLRGIDKLLGKDKQAEQTQIVKEVIHETVPSSGGSNVIALLKRGNMALEDGLFEEAKKYFDNVLNSDAECAEAYLGLFMAEMKEKNRESAKKTYIAGDYTGNRFWQRAKQFAIGNLEDELKTWETGRQERLDREAEAERKRTATEEEKQKKLQAEIESLQEQMKNGSFEISEEQKQEQQRLKSETERLIAEADKAQSEYECMPEHGEKKRLEEELSAKKRHLESLGIFKGSEKRLTQEQISALEKKLKETENGITNGKAKLDEKRKAAEKAKNQLSSCLSQANTLAKQYCRNKISALVCQMFESFGRYKTGEDGSVQPIEWTVLDIRDGKALLISKYALDCQKYNSSYTSVTWENCSLRTWLNGTFLKEAFSAEEQKKILSTDVPADKNPNYSTDPGNATKDKVFLLSINEANKYFSNDEERKCIPTAYTKANGAYTNSDYTKGGAATCWWRLRSPGSRQDFAAAVSNGGSVGYRGNYVFDVVDCVRPALWINLDS